MLTLDILDKDSAPEGSKGVLEATEEKFGFVPNLIGELAHAPAAVKAYADVSAAFESSSLSSIQQQVVLITTSVENKCHYCVAAHSVVAGMVGADDEIVQALREGERLDDAELEALRAFTRSVVKSRGFVPDPEVDAFLEAGYTKAQILEVITGVAQKTMSNYVNHLAETPVDDQFSKAAWKPEGEPAPAAV